MAEAEWTLYVRDSNLQRVAQIDDYQTLDVVARFNAVGAWELDLDRRVTGAAELFVAHAGIEIVRDGTTFLSGPVTRRQRTRDALRNRVTISGVDDTVWLSRRLAHPQPATAAPPYSTTEHDVRTGQCSTVLRAYVDVNVGPGALAARRLTGLTLAADPLLGTTVTGRARWQNLLELMQGLAVSGGGLGFAIRKVATALEFYSYMPVDRSASVKFSEEIGNLTSYRYETTAPAVTYVFAGGGGEGTARTIAENQDPDGVVGWGRIEQFADRRDTTVTSELEQEITTKLAEGQEQLALDAVPVDTPSAAYGTHYSLGDKVTVVVDDGGTELAEVVREVKVSLTPAGPQQVSPVIGTPGRRDLLRVLGSVRDLTARVVNLERR